MRNRHWRVLPSAIVLVPSDVATAIAAISEALIDAYC